MATQPRPRGSVKSRGTRAVAATREKKAGRVHLYAAMSLDGYIASPDGGVEFLDPYADAREGYTSFIRSIGSAVMGRGTYDFAERARVTDFGVPAYVVTHRPISAAALTTFSGDVRDLVAQMRAKHARDIWLVGGGELTKAFQDADLVDIWSISVVPTLLGAGIPMYPRRVVESRRLKLVRTHRYPSGVIALRYER